MINDPISKISYVSSADISTEYDVTFPFYRKENIKVAIKDLNEDIQFLIEGIGYTIDTDVALSTVFAKVKLLSPVSVSHQILIIRDADYVQPVDLPTHSNTVETMADRIVMLIQQLAEQVNRSLKVPLGEAEFNNTLPKVIDRAKGLVSFDDAGQLTIASRDDLIAEIVAQIQGGVTVTSSLPTLAAGQFLAGPVTGADAEAAGRAIESDDLPAVPATKVTGVLAQSKIANLPASKITTGEFDKDRLPVAGEFKGALLGIGATSATKRFLTVLPNSQTYTLEDEVASTGGASFLDKYTIVRAGVVQGQYDTLALANAASQAEDTLVSGFQQEVEADFGANYTRIHHAVKTTYITNTNAVPALKIPVLEDVTVTGPIDIFLNGTFSLALGVEIGVNNITTYEKGSSIQIDNIAYSVGSTLNFSNSHALINVKSKVGCTGEMNVQFTGSTQVANYVDVVKADEFNEEGGCHLTGGLFVPRIGNAPDLTRGGFNITGSSTARNILYKVNSGNFLGSDSGNNVVVSNCEIKCDFAASTVDSARFLNCNIDVQYLGGNTNTASRLKFINCQIKQSSTRLGGFSFANRAVVVDGCNMEFTGSGEIFLASGITIKDSVLSGNNITSNQFFRNDGCVWVGDNLIQTNATFGILNTNNATDTLNLGKLTSNKPQDTSNFTLTNYVVNPNLSALN